MSKQVHIVISADSLALPRPWNQKNLDQKPDAFFKIEDTYPQLVRQHLSTALPEREVIVSTFSARGSTMGRPAKMTRDLFDWLKPDAVIVHHGVVDCWERPNGKPTVDLESFEADVDTIMQAHLDIAPDVLLIVFTILPTNEHMLRKFPHQNEIIDTYNAAFRKHRDHPNLHLIDIGAEDTDLAARIVHEDGHHLSRFGHLLYAERLIETLGETLHMPRWYRTLDTDPEADDMAEAYKAISTEIATGDRPRAEASIERFDQTYGDSARGRYAVGRLYNLLGDPARAFRSLVLLDNADGERLNATGLLAITAFASLEARDALPFLQKAYFVDPSSRAIVFRLGRTFERLHQFRPALGLYEQFLKTGEDEEIRNMRDHLITRMNPEKV